MRWPLLVAGWVLAGGAAAAEFETFKGHGGPVMGLAVGPDGILASASFDNSVGLWDDGSPRWLEGHDAAVISLEFGPDGRLYSGGDDFDVIAWGETTQRFEAHRGKVTSLAVSPDGRWLASGSWDGDILLWPLFENAAPKPLISPGAGVNDVRYSADGKAVFAATSRGVLWRYDLDSGAKRPMAKHGFGINRFVVGEGWLAYGAVDGGTRVIDALSGALLHDFTLDRRPILAISYHAGAGQIAIGDGHGFISIIDTHNWKILKDFRAVRDGPIWALAFSNSGDVIYAGGIDDVIYAWPVALLDDYDPSEVAPRSFLRDAASMGNGERQFMRKCSICHALEPGPSRKAGPTLHGVFGRGAGTVPGYRYSATLRGSEIIWSDETLDALFDEGPDHYIPGSKMPMQVIAKATDRADLIEFLHGATGD